MGPGGQTLGASDQLTCQVPVDVQIGQLQVVQDVGSTQEKWGPVADALVRPWGQATGIEIGVEEGAPGRRHRSRRTPGHG
jgi:hypothetical protein